VTRWLWALIAILIVVILGAYFWPTIDQTIVAPFVARAPAPAPAPVAQTAPAAAPAPAAQTKPQASAPSAQIAPGAPLPAPVAQASPPSAAPPPGPQTAPPPPASAQSPAPAPSAPTATSVSSAAPASAGETAGQAPPTSGSSAMPATDRASLGSGRSAEDLVSALNRTKIAFASASSDVPADVTDVLKRAAADMKRLPPGHTLEIAGYTDSSGNPARNLELSKERAEAVRDALVKDGVNPDMLVAKGFGEARPIASNDTPEGRARNRRIEFHVLGTPKQTVADPSRGEAPSQ
jgi:outer membrane protein OmpA-like peptidoglycan-associated protein